LVGSIIPQFLPPECALHINQYPLFVCLRFVCTSFTKWLFSLFFFTVSAVLEFYLIPISLRNNTLVNFVFVAEQKELCLVSLFTASEFTKSAKSQRSKSFEQRM